jgi:tRNA(adenine34) deaminase
MQQALILAREAEKLGEVPIGAVLVKDGEIIGRGMNRTIIDCDPTAHAEIVALRDAAKNFANHRLVDTQLYVTLEPCTMCAGALIHARVSSLIYGAPEPKAGAVVSSATVLKNASLNHQVEVIDNICRDECSELMTGFFSKKRGAREK